MQAPSALRRDLRSHRRRCSSSASLSALVFSAGSSLRTVPGGSPSCERKQRHRQPPHRRRRFRPRSPRAHPPRAPPPRAPPHPLQHPGELSPPPAAACRPHRPAKRSRRVNRAVRRRATAHDHAAPESHSNAAHRPSKVALTGSAAALKGSRAREARPRARGNVTIWPQHAISHGRGRPPGAAWL